MVRFLGVVQKGKNYNRKLRTAQYRDILCMPTDCQIVKL